MNKFLSHLEKKASAGEVMRGMISPAWMDAHIAQKHGKRSPDGVWENTKTHMKGLLRASGRALLEGVGGSVAGVAAGALSKNPAHKVIGGVAGYYAGATHGAVKSLSNQAKEKHDKYSDHEKKANVMRMLSVVGRRTARQAAGKAKTFGTAMAGDAGKVGAQFTALRTGRTQLQGGRFTTPVSIPKVTAMKELAGNKAVQGATGAMAASAAGGAAIGAAMSNPNRQQEKRACMQRLLADGVNFDQAIELVKQAEEQVYGK